MTKLFALPVRNAQHPVPFTGGNATLLRSTAAPNDYPTYARAYQRNEIVFSCIEMLATSASEPHIVGRRFRRNAPQIRNEIRNEERRLLACGLPQREVTARLIKNGFFLDLPNHPLIRLLDNPNPWMSRGQQWGTVVMDLSLAGNAYMLKSRWQGGPLKGTVAELWRLRPDRVRIVPDPVNFIAGFEYGVGRDKIIFPPEDVIHFKTRNPLDDYYGMPPLMAVSGRVAIDEYMKGFLRTFFERGGTGPGAVLTVEQSLQQEAKDEIRKQHRRQFGQQGGYHELMVLDNAKTTYKEMGLDRGLRDALPQEIDAMQEARIPMVFGIPASILGTLVGMEASSYQNKRADREVFWKLTMTPLLSDLDDTLNRDLVPEFGMIDEVLFDLSDIEALQEEVDKLHDRARKDFESGGSTWEEYRAVIGLDPEITEGILLVPRLSTPTPVELLGKVVLADAAEKADEEQGEGDDPPAPPVPEAKDMITKIVAEVRCSDCGALIGRDIAEGTTRWCRRCKQEQTVAALPS